MNKKPKQPSKEQLFLKSHAQKLAHSFRLLLDADSPEEENLALGRIQALRGTMGDIQKISKTRLVTGIQVGIRSE